MNVSEFVSQVAKGRADRTLRFSATLPGPVRSLRSSQARTGRSFRREIHFRKRWRTLTNLYNEWPTWLDLAHRKIDEAVFAAYGWNSSLTDDEILAHLL